MVGSFWGHSVTSQGTHKKSSYCELAVRFHWVFNSHSKLTATTAWWAHWDDLTNSAQQAHGVSCKLTESSQQAHSVSYLLSSLRGNWVCSKWAHREFQYELSVSQLWAQIVTGRSKCITDGKCITIPLMENGKVISIITLWNGWNLSWRLTIGFDSKCDIQKPFVLVHFITFNLNMMPIYYSGYKLTSFLTGI